MLVFIFLLQNDLAQGNLSSHLLPDTVPMATALGPAAEIVLHLQGGAGPQQQRDHLDAAALFRHMQRRPASGRRPAPRVKASANESCWKTRKLRKLRIPKIS